MPPSDPTIKIPFASRLIAELAPEIGATVWLEPEFGFVGSITFTSGKTHFFSNTNFSVNALGPVKIARDKGYAAAFLRRFGYRVADSQTFFSEKLNARLAIRRTIDDGWDYACSLGLPVILKPNDASQGKLVTKVDTKEDYYQVAAEIFKLTPVMLVERFHAGTDYRVVVFDNEIISAYVRVPLSVVGDGTSTIDELITALQETFVRAGRNTIIRREDPRIPKKLAQQGYTVGSVPPVGVRVALLDNANLSTGGESIDITRTIHPDFARLAIHATRDMGLRLCGVDLLAYDLTRPLAENPDAIIIEINGSPGLDNYMAAGEEQYNTVKTMYRKILKALSQD